MACFASDNWFLLSSETTAMFHKDGSLPEGEDWIWVFGSNLAGRHGAGAAKVARLKFGAIYGVGEGRTGKAYAIPTKDADLKVLPLDRIAEGVRAFLEHAALTPSTRYFVTRVGCGLAGYTDDEIGPLFAQAPANCSLPLDWKPYVILATTRPLDPLDPADPPEGATL